MSSLMEFLHERGVSWRLLGGGSNLLVVDEGLDDVAIQLLRNLLVTEKQPAHGGPVEQLRVLPGAPRAWFADGQKMLDEVRSPRAFASGIESLKAAGYEGEQKFDKAAEHYLKAVELAELQGEKDYLKGEAARALAAAGKRVDAAKLWAELADKADSPMAAEAKIRVGELTATTAKP